MLKEKAGALAGQIWEALNGTEGLTQKQIKKATKLKADKDFFLGLGWLLREDKVVTSEVEGEIFVKLVLEEDFKLIKKCVGTSFFVCSQRIFLYICAKFKRRR